MDKVRSGAPGAPLVLKNVTLKIQGGERVGVCGRTGSGKTSLLLALFRMLRIEGPGPPAPIPPRGFSLDPNRPDPHPNPHPHRSEVCGVWVVNGIGLTMYNIGTPNVSSYLMKLCPLYVSVAPRFHIQLPPPFPSPVSNFPSRGGGPPFFLELFFGAFVFLSAVFVSTPHRLGPQQLFVTQGFGQR